MFNFNFNFNLFSSSGFATKKDIASFDFLNKQGNGIILGLNPYSKKMLIDSSNENVIAIGQCRTDKTVGTFIPTALNWNKSLICYDPKGEISKLTSNYREKILGQKVYNFHPYTTDGSSIQWNPFSCIRYNDKNEYMDIACLCSALIGIDDEKVTWYVAYPSSKLEKNNNYYLSLILTGLFMYIIKTKKNPTMMDLYCYVYEYSLDEIINSLIECPEAFRNSYKMYDYKFEEILKLTKEEKENILQILQNTLAPFSPELCSNTLSKSDFDFSDLLDDNYSIYITPSMKNIMNENIIITMFLQMIIQRMYEYQICWMPPIKPKKYFNTQVLFLLDEFHILPRLNNFFNILLASSTFGYSRFCITQQSLQALKNIYNDKFDMIFNMFSHRVILNYIDKYTLDTIMDDFLVDIPQDRLNIDKLTNIDINNVIVHFKGKMPIQAKNKIL